MAQTRPDTEHALPAPRLLKSGKPAHNFTPEERLKGAKRSAENRKERAKTHGQRVRDLAEKKEKPLVEALITQALTGDVRALQTLWAYAYGTPAKVEAEELDITVNSSDAPRAHDFAAVVRVAREAGIDVTSSGLGNGTTGLDA